MKNLTTKMISAIITITLSFTAIADGSTSIGPGNPASYYCQSKNGTSISVSHQRGQLMFCAIGRGIIGE